MDWVTILTSGLTFIGGGGLGAVLMFPSKRKSAELENEKKASEQWKELYSQAQNVISNQSNLIDKLREQNNRLLTSEAICKILECKKLKCSDRVPPIADNAVNNKIEEKYETE